MFGIPTNKSRWQKIAYECNDYYFKEAIERLIIPNNISLKTFAINLGCLKSGDSYNSEYCSGCTFHCIQWVDMPTWNRPLGFDLWFYAAFPDVAAWAQHPQATNEIKAATQYIPEDAMTGAHSRFTIQVLKIMIETYLKSSHRMTSLPRNILETAN